MDETLARACLIAAGLPDGEWSGFRELPAGAGDESAEAVTVGFGVGTDCVEATVATWSWDEGVAGSFAFVDPAGSEVIERHRELHPGGPALPLRSVLTQRFVLHPGERYARHANPPSRAPVLDQAEKAALVRVARGVAARGAGVHEVEGQPALGERALVHAGPREGIDVAFFSSQRRHLEALMLGREDRDLALARLGPNGAHRFASAMLLQIFRFSAATSEGEVRSLDVLSFSHHRRVWRPAAEAPPPGRGPRRGA